MVFDMGSEKWDLVGFTDQDSLLGKMVPAGQLFVPTKVELDKAQRNLLWSSRAGCMRVPDTRGMFNEFVELWDKTPSAILRYARKWGLLFLDRNGRPCSRIYDLPRGESREPIEAWKYFSRRAQSALNIAANLKCDKRGSPTDWEAFDGLNQWIGPESLACLGRRGPVVEMCARFGYQYKSDWDLHKERRVLALESMIWLDLGRPGFSVTVNGRDWRLEVDYNGCLFAAIALQLALTLSGSDSLFTCSGCGTPYVRQKKAPKPGQANYCRECDRKGVALQEADRRRRGRMADAKRLYAAGTTIPQIADELKTKTATVRRWLTKGN
jgi:hypothetical protein